MRRPESVLKGQTDRVGHLLFFSFEGGFNYSREMGPNTSFEWVQMTRLIFLHRNNIRRYGKCTR